MGARADLADAFQVAVDATGIPGVTVYDYPADVVKLPSVVIDAANDYIQPATYGLGGPGAYQWSFVIHITVSRADVSAGFTLIEELRQALLEACNTLGVTHGSMSGPETIPVNDVPTLQSQLDLVWITERTT